MDIREQKIRLWLKNPPAMNFPVPLNLPNFSKKSFRNYIQPVFSFCQMKINSFGIEKQSAFSFDKWVDCDGDAERYARKIPLPPENGGSGSHRRYQKKAGYFASVASNSLV